MATSTSTPPGTHSGSSPLQQSQSLVAPVTVRTREDGEPETPAEAIARMAILGHPNFALVKHCRTLIEDARLRVFSLAFNPIAQILVCTVCEHQVRRDCYKHLRDLHGMRKKGQMGRDIDTVIRVINVDLGVPTALRTFAPTVEPRAFIEGLASASVQGCSECPFVSSRRSAVNVHIAACAQGAKVLEDILVQRPNQDKAYIRVQPSRPPRAWINAINFLRSR
ncbi:hypothetical protein K525DRAFT_274693 [Schizophyllum commune Loenen D]|nr:hypothetical protein K525DRAFT_274693 [Schizophyllum commune Loenen D]